ncbi:MAG: alpha/beta fold hydrolase [Actinobacteria bacterium]|nr:alpha/beta fold hydrolase [Actinomycetota bacterium]
MAIKRSLAFFFVAVLGLATLSCSSGSSTSSSKAPTTFVKGSPDLPDFYGVPDPLPAGKPGELINSEPVEVPGLNGALSRVMYHSTNINGQDIAVTGLVLIPKGTAPSGGWPVITWAHGTTGIADACAPSLKPASLTATANGLLAAGYLVVASDFEGLGTPGRHPYIVGESEARGTLDIVRLAQSFPNANASKRYAVWGHSQGGHAAMFAGHIAKSYAPEIELVADVAGAPPSQLLLVNAALQTSPYKHYIAMVAAALNAAYGDQKADLTQVLTPEGIEFLKNMDTMCSTELGKAAAGLDFTKLQKADPSTIPTWNQLLKDNDPGTFTAPIPVPLLIIHGGSDEQIPVVSSALLFDQLCKIGQVEQRWVFAGQSHAGVIAPSFSSMMTWIGDRFAGKPMPDAIRPDGAVVQSCPSS